MAENENLEQNAQEEEIGTREETQPQPYIHEPLYKDLLQSFQNAEWEKCADLLTQLLELYPDNESLIEFQREISVRTTLQKTNDETVKEERRENIQKLIIRGIIILAVVGVVVFTAAWAVNRYQDNLEFARQESIEATRVQELATTYGNAEKYLLAGNYEKALELFIEIQEEEPNYEGISDQIAETERKLAIDQKYLEGIALFDSEEYEAALEIFDEVQAEIPQYENISYYIGQIEKTLKIESLLEGTTIAYNAQDWATVVENYNQIMALDNTADVSEIEEELFISYMNLILETADRPDASIEDVETAEDYYRAALAISPQNRELAAEREELERVTTNLLANKYYIYALELIQVEDYSFQAYEEALKLLNKANNIGSGSPAITDEIANITLYIDAVDDFMNKRWEDAITGLQAILRVDENYAEGFPKYLLYEAYILRGDIFFTYGENTSAIENYELAAIIAYGDSGNTLRLFETQVKSAMALQRLDSIQEATSYLHSAMLLVNYADKISDNAELTQTLNEAEFAYQGNNFWPAYNAYELVLEESNLIYEVETLEVDRGDSIPLIAFDYGSSINSIIEFNDLGDSLSIRNPTELLIPVLIEDQNQQ